MSRENPLWGAPRIHGELLKLGIDIGETSVGKYMVRHRKPPSQTWRTFLENHVKTMVSVRLLYCADDPVSVLYVFLVLAHDRRRIVHFNVTAHPTAEWTAQQLREAFPPGGYRARSGNPCRLPGRQYTVARPGPTPAESTRGTALHGRNGRPRGHRRWWLSPGTSSRTVQCTSSGRATSAEYALGRESQGVAGDSVERADPIDKKAVASQ
jgi:hypothetical protein